MQELLDKAEDVLGAHPKIFFFVVSVAIFIIGYSVSVFAQKTDFEAHIIAANGQFSSLESRITKLDGKLDSKFLLLDINRLESEIYGIETLEVTGEMLPRDRARIVQLRSQLNEARRQLSLLDQAE